MITCNRITCRASQCPGPAGRWLLLWLACLSCLAGPTTADPLRVLPEGQRPRDQRLAPQKDLNAYFPFDVPASKQAWQARSAELKRRILVATGLWPLPEKTPLEPVIHGRLERDGFTVERCYFQSVPNHYVTGLLFRPAGQRKNLPAVLCPHGHGGRWQDHGPQKIRQLIVEGQERFEDCGRYPKLSKGAQLARMGCVVLIYDMIGYADSVQISRELAHRFAKRRPEFDRPESWGLFSTQAELRLQSVMGLQTWNSIRALDFLCSLPDVDPRRVAVTGGSGGGTQTILLCAVDPRPGVAFPQGMVSTSMQGGCTCENCCLLRIGTGNVELAALFAPQPQAMTAADDWTREMMTKGYPELQQLYTMLGARQNVFCKSLLHFPHNYNYVTRAVMYSWLNKHLELGLDEPIVEDHWRPLTTEEWTVWNDDHPKPAGGADYERSLCKWLADQSDRQLAALAPRDAASLAGYRETVGGAFDVILGQSLADSGQVSRERIETKDRGSFRLCKDLVRVSDSGAELPVLALYPKKMKDPGELVIWVSGRGKSGLLAGDGQPCPAAERLLAAGVSVIGADLLYQGECLADGKPLQQTPVVSNPRQYAGYTFGYNHTVFAHRVHDILALVALVKKSEPDVKRIHLVGVDGGGPLAAAARAQAGPVVERAAVDTGGFRFVGLTSYRDPSFLPGAVKYGDLPALLALSAPHALWIAGEQGAVPDLTSAAYRAAGRPAAVASSSGPRDDVALAAVEWLLDQ